MTRTAQELRKRIEAANFNEIVVTMKCNGDRVRITPCSYVNIKKFEDIDWFLLSSPTVNLCGGDNIEKIANDLLRYAEYIEEDKEGLKQLKAHIRKYGKDSDWDFVSDYHKDLFGHRPHVGVDRLIAWANSNSENSARFF